MRQLRVYDFHKRYRYLSLLLFFCFSFSIFSFEVAAQGSDDFFLSGKVVLQGTSQPQAGYAVLVRVQPDSGFSTYNLTTDSAGNFSVNIAGASISGNNLDIITEVNSCSGLLSQSHSNNFGNTDSLNVLIEICVNAACVISFSATPDSSGNGVFFDGTASNVASVYYLFGDGSQPVYATDTTHTFAQPGAYEVCMNAADSNGFVCQFCDTINIYGSGTCSANFSFFSISPIQPNNITFFNQSSSPDSITFIQYDFGDGITFSATGPDVWTGVVHLFVTPGLTEVCLTIEDNNFCTSTLCQFLTIVTDTCNTPVTVNNTVLGDSTLWHLEVTNPVPSALYHWSFLNLNVSGPDLQFYTDSSFAPGLYGYCLQVIDTLGNCFSLTCDSIPVNLPPCQSGFSFNPDPQDPNLYFLNAQVVGLPTSYLWSIYSSSVPAVLAGADTSFTFPGPGLYPVCLEIGGPGCSDSYCDTIDIPIPPTCESNLSVSLLGLSSTFLCQYQSTVNGPYDFELHTGDGGIYSYTGASLSHIFQHSYATGGTYQACLNIRDTLGLCVDSICVEVEVETIPAGYTGVYIYAEQNGIACTDCRVMVCLLDSVSGDWLAIDTIYMDSSGFYRTRLLEGVYLFKAEADSNLAGFESYLPTYQGGVLYWNSGIPGLLPQQESGFCMCYLDTIRLVAGILPNGTSGIEGIVRMDGGNSSGAPVMGADILLLEINHLAIKRTKSDENGAYSLTDLNPGTYLVYPEVINRITYPVMIEVAQDSTIREVNFSVDHDIVFGAFEADIEKENMRVYPNPFQEDLGLSFHSDRRGMVLISVIDLQGKVNFEQWYPAIAGVNNITIGLAKLESGTYLIRVQSGDAAKAPISVIKIP